MLYYYENEIGFNAVEINYTYYRQPTARSMANMVRNTHRDFQFTVKAYREMTHDILDDNNRIRDNRDIFKDFLAGIEPLVVNKRLGCVLAQFPVMFDRNPHNLDYMAEFKRRMGPVPVVIEFRNSSWVTPEVFGFLRSQDLGYCIVDEPKLPRLMPFVEEITSNIAYLRLHGRNPHWFNAPVAERYNYIYTEDELRGFVPKIREISSKAGATFVFFNNCHGGKAAKNALKMMELLEIGPNTNKLL